MHTQSHTVPLQILNVALDVPLDRLFDYANAGFHVSIGCRVVVPFGGRKLVGLVMGISSATEVPPDKLKPVIHVFEDVPLDGMVHKLIKFCADYYHYPLGQALLSCLPVRLRQIKPAVTRQVCSYRLDKAIPEALIGKRQVVLQRLVHALQTQTTLTEPQLASLSKAWRKALHPFIQQGYVQTQQIVAVKPSIPSSQQVPLLNSEQASAIEAILSTRAQFKPWLLYGVTGSGKTEVYIQLLHTMLSAPQAQALVLVPEINLTPQLEARFRSRLSQFPLVTLHSHLSESERLQHWQAATTGVAKIVIGTRLSVFTPMPYLKIILIDEEHDGSYKQQDGMRYHARDVAMMRAKQANIPIVLGSATPSLETWYLAHKVPPKEQGYGLLTLTERAVAQSTLPKVLCIDTAKSPVENGLSPLLMQAIAKRLEKKEQSLLFINRRGYAPVLHCNACQWTANCTCCSAKLVVHLSQKRLKCHHCGHEQAIPLQCPGCGNPDLHPVGQATQRLTQTLQQCFPNVRVARVDRDSVRNKHALTTLLSQVYAGEVDILVGTQMLAKGHDFPNLTLVGVVDTDAALYSPDFRAAERLFSQLMQVAGRAGRGQKAGEVLIQTHFPQHALFNALRAHDYTSYANALLQERISMQFPPVQYFALIKAEASDYVQVERLLSQAANLARSITSEVLVYDPVRPQLERLKGMERGQLLFQSATRFALKQLFKSLIPLLKAKNTTTKVRWLIDIDPLELT